mmetsp:Transcript_17890/g.21433  ORF Transcript_17890/g.21433 Transcript_17890/m.21433 type:complete len:275 (-) Transcript_17890:166-990(-)
MTNQCQATAVLCLLITILAAMITGFTALGKSFTNVSPGEIGIVVTRGNLRAIGPGRHQVRPFISDVDHMTTKTQLLEQEHVIPTKEGLAVQLETAVQYRLDADKAKDVYKEVGKDYSGKIIAPAAASTIRSLTSNVEAKALYTNGRDQIQADMKDQLTAALDPRGIIVENVYLKGIVLPSQLRASIELKAKAEQEAEQMEFKLEKERQEAERKAIEAQGIADFQRIVSEGINGNLLKWKGIEATERLADSDNAKLVIMGNGEDGLPVILNGGGE